ncbi:MAG TPA: galactose-1-phosphate uridylyltransferase [Ktedonobacteraceae bacterium]
MAHSSEYERSVETGQGMEDASFVWNPILRHYALSAPHRMHRREGVAACPFCADLATGRVGPQTRAWLRSNDFPPLFPPAGEAYVVIYSPDHQRSFPSLSVAEVYEVTRLWRDLYRDLAARYACVMIFENHGEAIGQTQQHPHGQAYGLANVPPLLEREMETVILAEQEGRGCPFCAVRAALSGSPFEVAANATWQVFLPPYARYPYETHLYPRRHIANLADMPDDELRDLAALLLAVIGGYNALAEGALAPMPYMLGLHQLADERFHLHVEILAVGRAPGKLKYAASSESLWGLWTNDSAPAEKARELRLAIEKGDLYA